MSTLQTKLKKWNLNGYLSDWPSQFVPLEHLWHLPKECITQFAKQLKMNNLDEISFQAMMHEIYVERDLYLKRRIFYSNKSQNKDKNIIDLTVNNNTNDGIIDLTVNTNAVNGIIDLTVNSNAVNGIIDLTVNTNKNNKHINLSHIDNNNNNNNKQNGNDNNIDPRRKSNRNRKLFRKSLNFNYCDCYLLPNTNCGENDHCINRESNIECTIDTCNVQYSKCLNRRFTKKIMKKIFKKMTTNKGFGLFTLENIPKNSFIIEYEGELINITECTKRIHHKYKYDKNFYIIKIGNNQYIDAKNTNCLAKFANHSCSPNCKISVWICNKTKKVALFALTDINKHEELCFDYKYDCWNNIKQRCFCNSNNCKGFLC